MNDSRLTRRNLLQVASIILPFGAAGFSSALFGGTKMAESSNGTEVLQGNTATERVSPIDGNSVSDAYPGQAQELVREVVTVAHFDLKRVKELVDLRPSLAVAAWDWGFGDRETALGAASHMGNRPIAEYLMSQGAQPSIFSATMLGQIDVVKAFVAAQPGVQRIRGPHGISLLAHARMGGAAAKPVFDFLQALGDADTEAPVPLPEAEATALVGTYTFGRGIAQQIEVTADTKMYAGKMYASPPQLNWTRKGTQTRPLFHIGGHAFYPAGAPSARIKFTQDASAVVMTMTDGDMVFTARKS
jgi:hypothetical protein